MKEFFGKIWTGIKAPFVWCDKQWDEHPSGGQFRKHLSRIRASDANGDIELVVGHDKDVAELGQEVSIGVQFPQENKVELVNATLEYVRTLTRTDVKNTKKLRNELAAELKRQRAARAQFKADRKSASAHRVPVRA